MRTFGIDLASQPGNTAICLIEWRGDQAAVVDLARGKDRSGDPLNDERLMQAMLGNLYGSRPTMTAIDAPLGWPTLFADVIANQAAWPDAMDGNPPELLRRATDLEVAHLTGKQPLAVTTERIAYAAIRANRILGQLQRTSDLIIDRSGTTGAICETYPDAAIRQFGLWPADLVKRTSYKDKDDPAVRRLILDGLRARAPWLVFDGTNPELVHSSDDCLDALICALVARACAKGDTIKPVDDAPAAVEGWIHLPGSPGGLEALIRD